MKRFLMAGAAMCLCAGAAQAADITVGTATSNTCLPFGCAQSNTLQVFQEIYAGSAFLGLPTSIGSVSFYKDAATSTPGATLETMSFNLSFYQATTTVANLTNNLAGNRGALLADFGTFTISGAAPDVLTFASSTAFTYNPSAGALLLQITVLSDTAAGSGLSFKSDIRTPGQGALVRRAYSTDFGTSVATNGLVTTFSSKTAPAVPEPATWAMMLMGFGLVGGTLRRRQKVNVRFA